MRLERAALAAATVIAVWSLPGVAAADMAVPVLFSAAPSILVLLIPVVLIETLVVRRWLDLRWVVALRATLLANVASSIVGLLVVPVLHGLVAEVYPAVGAWYIAGVEVPDRTMLLTGFWLAFAFTFLGSVAVEFIVLLVVLRRSDRMAVFRATLVANALSYALLAAVVIVWPQGSIVGRLI